MDAITLDQVRVFLAIVDEGSFPKAAKALHRAQSAVTYAVRKLEAQTGVVLFDRSAYRSTLTAGGRAMLVRARRMAEEADAFREQARSLASGLEPELTLVVDAMYPMPLAVDALRALAERFPTVPPRVHVQSLGAAAQLVLDGTCAIGLLPAVITDLTALRLRPTTTIELVPVAAPSHPLAAGEGVLEAATLDRHVQLVLTDASPITAGTDHGVLSSRTWRLADLGAKKAMLIAGLGWGTMPRHLIEDELADGRLRRIEPADYDRFSTSLVVGAAVMPGRTLGPAGRWMLDLLCPPAGGTAQDPSEAMASEPGAETQDRASQRASGHVLRHR
jgi:DNA-binding transcriptional LysR family regulator